MNYQQIAFFVALGSALGACGGGTGDLESELLPAAEVPAGERVPDDTDADPRALAPSDPLGAADAACQRLCEASVDFSCNLQGACAPSCSEQALQTPCLAELADLLACVLNAGYCVTEIGDDFSLSSAALEACGDPAEAYAACANGMQQDQ